MNRFWQMFAWWGGTTYGTSFTTWLRGEYVGEDQLGNRYFRSKGGRIDPVIGRERRWVIYKDIAEASLIPPGWHGWMHHRTDVAPLQPATAAHPWERPHRPNYTGTPLAYRPPGSILSDTPDAAVSEGYVAWSPFADEAPKRPPNVSPVSTPDGP